MKIVLKNLTKIFPSRNKKEGGEVIAVNNFDFEIPDLRICIRLLPEEQDKRQIRIISVGQENRNIDFLPLIV